MYDLILSIFGDCKHPKLKIFTHTCSPFVTCPHPKKESFSTNMWCLFDDHEILWMFFELFNCAWQTCDWEQLERLTLSKVRHNGTNYVK